MKFWNFIWQLPQNLLGFIITRFRNRVMYVKIDNNYVLIYFVKHFNYSAVSLGNYLIFDYFYYGKEKETMIRHEMGHQKQSQKLGWLYLLVVGLPSLTRNIYHRIFHKKWNNFKKQRWYYGGYPEKQADKLGGVKRQCL